MRLLSFLVVLSLVMGCGQPQMTADQKAADIKAVESQIGKFFGALEERDVEKAKSLISTSGDFVGFGTDVAEVMKSQSDFKEQIEADLQLFESVKSGDLKHLSIQISNSGDLASAYYEIPVDVTMGGETSSLLVRFAHTYRKEHGEWRMVQSMASMPSSGQSTFELLNQRQSSKNE